MKNKGKIEKKLKRKTNKDLVRTIILCKKKNKWLEVANLISTPRKNRINLNLDEINKASKDNEIIIVPGKVLSIGNIDKKIKIVALSFSKEAKEKLKKSKVETSNIEEEIKKNSDAKNIKILK